MDIRRIQRTLFRMQADPTFAAQLFAGQAEAWESTGLEGAGRELLETLDPAGVAADPGDKRRTQIAGNSASEFAASLTAAAALGLGDLIQGFPRSSEFHNAVAEDGRLPFAFGAFAWRIGAGTSLEAVAGLETQLAVLRRAPITEEALLVPGDLRLSSRAHLLELESETHNWVQGLRDSLTAGVEAPPAPSDLAMRSKETVVILVQPSPSAHQLHEVTVERLEPPTDALLARARLPFLPEQRATFARNAGTEPEILEAFLNDWVEEGILRRG